MTELTKLREEVKLILLYVFIWPSKKYGWHLLCSTRCFLRKGASTFHVPFSSTNILTANIRGLVLANTDNHFSWRLQAHNYRNYTTKQVQRMIKLTQLSNKVQQVCGLYSSYTADLGLRYPYTGLWMSVHHTNIEQGEKQPFIF